MADCTRLATPLALSVAKSSVTVDSGIPVKPEITVETVPEIPSLARSSVKTSEGIPLN